MCIPGSTKLNRITERNSSKTIQLNINLLGDEPPGSILFVRDCYPRLLDTTLSIINIGRSRHLAIIGTPGIGKTYFGYFLMYHLARQPGTPLLYTTTESLNNSGPFFNHPWLLLETVLPFEIINN